MNEDILSVIYLILILILILPGFIYANKNKKLFLNNLFIWFLIKNLATERPVNPSP